MYSGGVRCVVLGEWEQNVTVLTNRQVVVRVVAITVVWACVLIGANRIAFGVWTPAPMQIPFVLAFLVGGTVMAVIKTRKSQRVNR